MHFYTKRFIKIFNWCVGMIIGIPILFYMMTRKKKIPHISNPILLKSATELAAMIRMKQIKSEELVRAYIKRIDEVNPILNAVVQSRFSLAIRDAQEADRLIASGQYSLEELMNKYPLLGIPVTIKESISVKGMSNKAGRVKSVVDIAADDSQAVSQLRAAGGIPIAVTNTPELCMSTETFNYVTGRTYNPYDTRKTSGGSSGGEAALISSGASIIGVGSDIAGSVRIPALYCGLFSHKPTSRVISVIGHVPHCDDKKWKDVFAFGPIVRYVEDLTLMMEVLKDPNGPTIDFKQPVSVRELKFYYMEGDNFGAADEINADIKDAFKKVINYFDNTYHITVKKVNMKYMQYGFETQLFYILGLEGIVSIFSNPKNVKEMRSVWPEIFKKIFGCSNSPLSSIMYGIIKKVSRYFPESDYRKAAEMNVKMQKEFKNLLQDDGIFFYPTAPRTATYHCDYYRNMLNISYAALFNGLGLPASHCTLGLTRQGMPVGIQVVAGHGQDHLTIAVCKELEKAFGGWVPPP